MHDQLLPDLVRLKRLVLSVAAAAKQESVAMRAAHDERGDEVELLYAIHLAELDAVQALVAAMELLEHRHPRIKAALALTAPAP